MAGSHAAIPLAPTDGSIPDAPPGDAETGDEPFDRRRFSRRRILQSTRPAEGAAGLCIDGDCVIGGVDWEADFLDTAPLTRSLTTINSAAVCLHCIAVFVNAGHVQRDWTPVGPISSVTEYGSTFDPRTLPWATVSPMSTTSTRSRLA